MTTCEIDLRVGGAWRYAMRPQGGDEFAFYGEFLELVPDEKVVQTETFEPFPDHRVEEHDDPHRARRRDPDAHARPPRLPEARDMHVDSGMEAGMQDAFDRLEQVAISLA